MRFTTAVPALLVALSATCAAGFSIPEGQPDGIYEVSIQADGTETHTFLRNGTGDYDADARALEEAKADAGSDTDSDGELERRRAPGTMRIEGRQDPTHVVCINDEATIPATDCDNANRVIDSQCGTGTTVGDYKSFYSIQGCAVAYFCNFSRAYHCAAATRQEWSRRITAQCGRYHPGYGRYTKVLGNSISVSYGYENWCTDRGKHYCGS